MPLDATNFTLPAVEPLSDDPAVAVRQAIEALRRLPYEAELRRFGWTYLLARFEYECGTRGCAIGWFGTLWPGQFSHTRGIRPFFRSMPDAKKYFGMDEGDYYKVFANANDARGITMCQVTPAMVADDLEAWADEKHGRPAP